MSPRHASPLTLEYVLLALLDQKPMHGYELYQEICGMQGISKIWNIKQALLYAILEKLEERGFLTSKLIPGETYPPRKYFHLTEIGQSSFQEWLKTPVRRARDLRQEFLAKLIIAHRFGKADLLALIHIQEEACQAWARDLQSDVPPLTPEHLDEWMVYSFRVNRVEAVLKWLKRLEGEIDRLLGEK
jgi:PadR family transcriptional regulator, regulatory protein AphA